MRLWQEREEKIRLRKEEAEKKKEDHKLVKKLAQEKQRILQVGVLDS